MAENIGEIGPSTGCASGLRLSDRGLFELSPVLASKVPSGQKSQDVLTR